MYQKDQIGDNLPYKICLTNELKPIYCKEVNIFKNNKRKLMFLCVPQTRYHIKLFTSIIFSSPVNPIVADSIHILIL